MALILGAMVMPLMGQPSWTVMPTRYQNSMSIVAKLNVEGELSSDANDLVGIFSGGECRGVAGVALMGGDYYLNITVWSNASADEVLSVKVYDASSGIVYDLKQRLTFVKDAITGSYSEPFVFYTNLSLRKLDAYNFISPNGDGKNDYFIVDDLLTVSDMTLKIYSSNGVEVFVQRSYDNTWNGVDRKGNDLPKGVYYYVFVEADGTTVYKGSITLVK
jgi:gliding motility-associated-like protein